MLRDDRVAADVKFIAGTTRIIITNMSQCLGRLVGETVAFQKGGTFYLTRQCPTITRSELCDSCIERQKKTEKKLASKTGIGRSHEPYLLGRIDGPIPDWSHMYGSEWFRLKQEKGSTLSEETMARLNLAKPKEVKVAAEKVLEKLPVVQALEKPKVKAKRTTKATDAKAKVEGALDIGDYDVVHIHVQKKEIDGRVFYLDSKKDKLYDMKFKYIGRLKDNEVVPHPDSDQD